MVIISPQKTIVKSFFVFFTIRLQLIVPATAAISFVIPVIIMQNIRFYPHCLCHNRSYDACHSVSTQIVRMTAVFNAVAVILAAEQRFAVYKIHVFVAVSHRVIICFAYDGSSYVIIFWVSPIIGARDNDIRNIRLFSLFYTFAGALPQAALSNRHCGRNRKQTHLSAALQVLT